MFDKFIDSIAIFDENQEIGFCIPFGGRNASIHCVCVSVCVSGLTDKIGQCPIRKRVRMLQDLFYIEHQYILSYYLYI